MPESNPFERLEGKYEILEKLREGGMGAVYKVKHRLLEEVRVIKVMRPQLAQDEVLRERFLREAKTAIRLRHDNLAQIYDFALDEEGTSFIVMEFIDGVSLEELGKALGPPSLGLILEVAHQTLSVLGYLHRKHVIHRDIAPDNILLTRNDDGGPLVKVIDLGIAKATEVGDGLTRTGTFIGKVRYCSPEHFRTHEGAKVDPRSDLYSFGIVLYELLTGVYPIHGKSTSGLITGHLVKPPIPFSQSDPEGRVPAELQAAIVTALEKKPEARFQNAELFQRAIEPLRERIPFAGDEMERLFATAPVVRLPARPGGTQDRLDRSFGPTATPPPIAEVPSLYETAGDAVQPTAAAPPERTPRTQARARSSPSAATIHQQVKALLLGAEKLAQLHHYDEARVQLSSALELDPDNAEAQKLLGDLEEAAGKRQAQRAKQVAGIESLIAAGNLDQAARKLETAVHRYGGGADFEILQDTVQRAIDAAHQVRTRVEERLATARMLLKEHSYEDAVEALSQALAADPGNVLVEGALREAEAALERQHEQKRREQEIATAHAAISGDLDRGRLDEAERALALAVKLHGSPPQIDALKVRLSELREREKLLKAATLRQEATALIEAGQYQEAITLLEQAWAVVPDDQRTTDLIGAAREGMRQAEERRKRKVAVDQAVQGIDRLILAGRLETAYRRLDAVLGELGDFAEAADLRGRVEGELAERREQEARASAVLDRARRLADQGRLDAARQALDEVRGLAAEQAQLLDSIEEVEVTIAQREEEQRRAQAVAEAVAGIDRCLGTGAFDAALHELEAAERSCGPQPVLAEMRRRIEEQRRAARQAEVEQLLREALGKQVSFREVIARLERALEIDPTNEKVQRLLAETRTGLHRYEHERRAAAIAEAMATVDQLILEGKLPEALAAVDEAVARLGDFREARIVREHLGGKEPPKR